MKVELDDLTWEDILCTLKDHDIDAYGYLREYNPYHKLLKALKESILSQSPEVGLTSPSSIIRKIVETKYV